MKMYKKYLLLLLVSIVALCQKKEFDIDTTIDRVEVSLIPSIPVLESETDLKGSTIEYLIPDTEKTVIIATTIAKKVDAEAEKKEKSVVQVVIDTVDTSTIVNKGECYSDPPPSMLLHTIPNTTTEASKWAKWMYAKAVCFQLKNSDSCYAYTQRGIATFENGSLFYLKAYCLLEIQNYSAAKTAAEICLNRVDHWNSIDKVNALKIKIDALNGIYKTFPSLIVEKEIENAQAAYNNVIN